MADLIVQAEAAHRLNPDLIEWRADFLSNQTTASLLEAAASLRKIAPNEAIIFTLRAKGEGGALEIPQSERRVLIESVLRSGLVDIVDLELANDAPFLNGLMQVAKDCKVPVILAFHAFDRTPGSEELLEKIGSMGSRGASIAKIAVMPKTPEDALGKSASAPGQIPMDDARKITEMILRYS
jgi:3-dehydroquinate dehydratase-1